MKTFCHLLWWDFVLQFRQRFWLAGLVVTLVWIPLVSSLPPEHANRWVSALLFGDICIIGLMFIAGILFLEKRQGSIYAAMITPLPTSTWILSKVVSLTVLCTLISSTILFFKAGESDWLRVIVAVSLSASFYTLLGLIIASPFSRINNYFICLSLTLMITSIPIYWHLGIIDHFLLWALPSYPTMILLAGCLNNMPPSEFYKATGILLLWIFCAFHLSIKAFHHFISKRKEGLS